MKAPRNHRATDHGPLEFVDATRVRVGRRTLLYFGGCNYLGLSWHPAVLNAMAEAAAVGPTQTGASRTTTGEHRLHLEAERALARFFLFPASAWVSCGYLAPLAAVQALAPSATHVILNTEAHACVRDAAAASGLRVIRMATAAPESLARCLGRLPRDGRPVFLTDGTFGVRGGMPPLATYLALLPSRGWMMVDDAHGAGAVGPGGRGAVAHSGIRDPRVVVTLSLAKALGVGGGAVLGPADVIARLRGVAGAYVGSTAVPRVLPAGVLASLRVIRQEPQRVGRLHANQRRLFEKLPRDPAIQGSPETPVTGIFPGTAARAEAIQRSLVRSGIYPTRIRYLSGPAQGFFRLAVSSEHAAAEIDLLADAVAAGFRGSRSRRD